MSSYSFRRRVFLASISTGFTSYVMAEVESSRGGEYKFGNYIVSIADCHRRIELEFLLSTARFRRHSLAKIDLLIEVLTGFRLALKKESDLIAQWEKQKKRSRVKLRRLKPEG